MLSIQLDVEKEAKARLIKTKKIRKNHYVI